MRTSLIGAGGAVIGMAVVALGSQALADHKPADFGTFVQDQLNEHAEQLFGIKSPLDKSAGSVLMTGLTICKPSRSHPGCERGMFDNVAFQPHTGNLVVLEDNSVTSVTNLNPLTTELRGNDLWICLPDGDDDDVVSDGCVRFASIRDTSAEPTGFKFLGSGEAAYVNIQHRAFNDNLGPGNHGALVKISGFKVKQRRHHQHNGHVRWDDDGDFDWFFSGLRH